MNTIEDACGRWREILPQLGIAHRFLKNQHGPCPLCGGRDRFRWDNRDGSGSYYCNQCGPGMGIHLIRKLHGWDHATACRAIDEIIGRHAPPPMPRASSKPAAPSSHTGARKRLEAVLRGARDRGIVERYLAVRGLRVHPHILRGHPELPYMEGEQFAGRHPAMVAPVLGPDGTLQSVHRTYMARVESRKKLMPPVDTVKGAAVRLFEADDELGVAEGIETAIAAHELFGMPVWACISTSGMETFDPPEGVRRVTIFADHDANFAGQKAAYVLASRIARNVEVAAIRTPLEPDTDWLDVLNEKRAAA